MWPTPSIWTFESSHHLVLIKRCVKECGGSILYFRQILSRWKRVSDSVQSMEHSMHMQLIKRTGQVVTNMNQKNQIIHSSIKYLVAVLQLTRKLWQEKIKVNSRSHRKQWETIRTGISYTHTYIHKDSFLYWCWLKRIFWDFFFIIWFIGWTTRGILDKRKHCLLDGFRVQNMTVQAVSWSRDRERACRNTAGERSWQTHSNTWRAR